MIFTLTPEESEFVRDFLPRRSRDHKTLAITGQLVLMFGGLLIGLGAWHLVQHLTDTDVYLVGLPNFVAGILLIAVSQFLGRKAAEWKMLTAILSKLREAEQRDEQDTRVKSLPPRTLVQEQARSHPG